MNNLLKVIILSLIIAVSVKSTAQTKYKFGHIDSNKLMEMMPERDSAQKSIQNYATQLEDQLKTMQDELEKKYNEYMASQDKMSNLIKQTKEKELQELNKRITDFQASAQKDIHTKETELLDPIVQKARKAVEEVGKENKFTYIYDISGGMVLYFSPESEDVMPLVKTKLGIKK